LRSAPVYPLFTLRVPLPSPLFVFHSLRLLLCSIIKSTSFRLAPTRPTGSHLASASLFTRLAAQTTRFAQTIKKIGAAFSLARCTRCAQCSLLFPCCCYSLCSLLLFSCSLLQRCTILSCLCSIPLCRGLHFCALCSK
jgi:hypothetical protein